VISEDSMTERDTADTAPGPRAGVEITGPLAGVRVLEMAAIGPAPFCAMLLADLGAEVVRVDRRSLAGERSGATSRILAQAPERYVMHRGRRSVAVDLKHPGGRETVLRLAGQADALVEGFRPGVMERLGLGPADCLEANPRLVYGRMTGWGQDGPLSPTAGHDINYIALAGALNNFARAGQPPVPPVNLVGDMGGGGLFLAFGVVCALLEARGSGCGQVVDAAMTDGTAALTVLLRSMLAQGRWHDQPGTNFSDTGSPYYEVYATSDGRYVAVGAIEEPFWRELLERLGLDEAELGDRADPANWPAMKQRLAAVFAGRTRQEWEQVFAGSDACVTPVLSLTEAPSHPHHQARGTFVERDGIVQPAPGPRFSRTPGRNSRRPPAPGEHTGEALAAWGFPAAEISRLRAAGAIG
jgi:alpha-methylacyl-CoA racemase